jgi:hypothetical protein
MLPVIKFWRRERSGELEKEFVRFGDRVDEIFLDFYERGAFFSADELDELAVCSLGMIRRAWNLNYEYVDSFVFGSGYSSDYYKLEEKASLLFDLVMDKINR